MLRLGFGAVFWVLVLVVELLGMGFWGWVFRLIFGIGGGFLVGLAFGLVCGLSVEVWALETNPREIQNRQPSETLHKPVKPP